MPLELTDNMRGYELKACEEVDACVFTGEITRPETLQGFAEYVGRWNRAVRAEQRLQLLEKFRLAPTTVKVEVEVEPMLARSGNKRKDIWMALKAMPIGCAIQVNRMDSNIRNGVAIAEVLLGIELTSRKTSTGWIILRTS